MKLLTGFSDAMPAFTDDYYEETVVQIEEVIDLRPWHDPVRSDMPDGLRWHHTVN